ncbi:hypothetical protein [Frankia sp. Cj5]|uniref:hypothetical protein n=1 Tax=Frankia sp. Cj5 TaxID=2880978 RepID=UPI001EF58191|nr:hypothetical protein [Frankia sp. Cj5]
MTGPVVGAGHNGQRNAPPASGMTHDHRALIDLVEQPGASLAVPAEGPGHGSGNARDPDLDDPRTAAAHYRALLGELDQARTKVADQVLAGQERRAALARAHRDSAQAIRAKVEDAWRTMAEPLAQHGISDLDQLRPSPVPDADERAASGVALPEHTGRSSMRAQHRRAGAGGRGRPSSAALERITRSGRPAAGAGDTAAFDPAGAPARAHELCLTAMGHAAELRAVTRAGSTASAAIVIGLACLLIAAGVTALRLFLDVAALATLLATLAVAALVAGVCVAALTDTGRVETARAALLGAGTAGAAVLATVRVAPLDPPGVIISLVVLALAVRFGLGVGAPRDPRRQ